jgi:hypothetical protein
MGYVLYGSVDFVLGTTMGLVAVVGGWSVPGSPTRRRLQSSRTRSPTISRFL